MLAANANDAHAANLCGYTFTQKAGAENPFDQVILGPFSAPAIADLDHDGDQDVAWGGQGGTFYYYLNTGNRRFASYTKQTGASNPFNGIDVGYASVLAYGDLDGDGDLDVLTGSDQGTVRYFRNDGTAFGPLFTERTGSDNLFNGVDAGLTSAPAMADLDGDGDLDVVLGDYDGNFKYFKNTGTALAPAFSEQTGIDNPLDGIDIGKYTHAAFIDVDRDGDLDIFTGVDTGGVLFFENTGTPLAPAFVERTGVDNPMQGLDTGDYSHVAFGDLDGDGDLDALLGGSNLMQLCIENEVEPALPVFTQKTGAENPFDGILAGVGNNRSAPALGDLDGDGDLDALIGDHDGTVRYFKNTGTRLAPVFQKQAGAANPFNGFFVPIGDSTIGLADYDGDADLDVFFGMYNGRFYYFKNLGTVVSPAFQQQFSASNPLDGPDLGENTRLAVVDMDGDGDMDAISGQGTGFLRYFRNFFGTLIEQGGQDNPFNGIAGGYASSPALVDIDRDGDLDVLAGNVAGTLELNMNFGSSTGALFTLDPSKASPFYGVDLGANTAPTFGDLDGDGDMDLVVGELDGNVNYFEQTGDCAPLAANCKNAITLPLDVNGDAFIRPEDLDNGSSANTAKSVLPNTLYCSDLGVATPVTLTVTNLFGETDTCEVNVTVEDVSGPTIDISGPIEMTIECGGLYVEQGAFSGDACDATVSATIGGDTVNTEQAGIYIVTYSSSDGSGNSTQATRTVTVQGNCSASDLQTADRNADHVIQLSELLRVIQFYNSFGYHCADNPGDTEDGYVPGIGANQSCTAYATDYNPQNWLISLAELLRVIQFYNSFGYHYCPADGTEDDFCPGLA